MIGPAAPLPTVLKALVIERGLSLDDQAVLEAAQRVAVRIGEARQRGSRSVSPAAVRLHDSPAADRFRMFVSWYCAPVPDQPVGDPSAPTSPRLIPRG